MGRRQNGCPWSRSRIWKHRPSLGTYILFPPWEGERNKVCIGTRGGLIQVTWPVFGLVVDFVLSS